MYFFEGDAILLQNGISVSLQENVVVEKGSQISLKQNALVVLFMGEKAAVLNEATSYSYETMLELLNKTERNIAGKYIKQLQEFSLSRPKDGYRNINVGQRMPHDGGEGIDFPLDSSIIITDAAVLVLDKEALPAYLYIYDSKKVIFRITAETSALKIFNTGLLEAGKWYGMSVTSEDNAPYASILNIKWATQKERESIKAEQGTFLKEIKDLPFEVQVQIMQLFDNDKRYDGADY